MILRLDIERLRTLEEVRDFLAGSEPVDFHFTDRRGAYDFVTRALRRLNYGGLSKAHKGVVRRFVAKVTGWSRAQTTRLIGQYRKTGRIEDRRRGATRPFERRYTAADKERGLRERVRGPRLGRGAPSADRTDIVVRERARRGRGTERSRNTRDSRVSFLAAAVVAKASVAVFRVFSRIVRSRSSAGAKSCHALAPALFPGVSALASSGRAPGCRCG